MPGYKRVLLKLSGEALMGDDAFGINPVTIDAMVSEIAQVVNSGVELAIVIGGGNIYRGTNEAETGIERAHGDYMGMLATVINSMALQSALESLGIQTRLQSAIKMEAICEPFIRRRAVRHLEKGRVVIFGAGTGNPYFTTDTAASLRAIEIEADVILKGTRVDGIYTADPKKDPSATRYDQISFNEAISKNLAVMDATAFALCRDQKLPINVDTDLTPIANIAGVYNMLVFGKHVKFRTVPDLIEEAKKNPGKLTYASAGNGTTSHLAGELFKLAAGIDMVHVPYKSDTMSMGASLLVTPRLDFEPRSAVARNPPEAWIRSESRFAQARSGYAPGRCTSPMMLACSR